MRITWSRLAGWRAKAIDGIDAGANDGSGSAAVFRREAVIVTDSMHDPLWEKYCGLAAAHGYPSCWSTPIESHEGAALGTFVIYSAKEGEPTEVEIRLIDVATRIASIAIQRKRAEDRIQFMANHDALIGLPNRTLLEDRLSQSLLYAQRYDRWATVVFIDLDNFKVINDSLGHNAGDELLKTIANRMVDCVRATDTVVRFGGDEFVVLLLDQPKDIDAISATIQRLASAVAEPVNLDGHELRLTASMGIANYPSDGTDADTLLANADAAMYRAKAAGRDNFRFYTPELNTKVHEKFLLQATRAWSSAVQRATRQHGGRYPTTTTLPGGLIRVVSRPRHQRRRHSRSARILRASPPAPRRRCHGRRPRRLTAAETASLHRAPQDLC